jgi:hypothetical protein
MDRTADVAQNTAQRKIGVLLSEELSFAASCSASATGPSSSLCG